MFALLLQAIAMATRPDSTEVLTRKHLNEPKRRPAPRPAGVIPKKKVRRWKVVFEHKDTPIHHH